MELIKEVKSTAEATYPLLLSTDAYHEVLLFKRGWRSSLRRMYNGADAFGMAALATEVNTPVSHHNA